MDTIKRGAVRLQPLNDPWFHQEQGVSVSVLRLDEVHPDISGNKWFKLRENLEEAARRGCTSVLSFGGPFSNHLHALAAMAKVQGLQSIGIVRGLHEAAGKTLLECKAAGMELHFISRAEYAQKNNPAWLDALQRRHGTAFIIPEGGANEWGRRGAQNIAAFIPQGATHVCCAAGTGTTVAGLRAALPACLKILAFTPFKNGGYLEADIAQHLPAGQNINWQIIPEYHFGGFGKMPPTLKAFMHAVFTRLALPLDRVYTAKMMYGLQAMLAQNFFPEDSRVVAVHTGGLQGNAPGDLPAG